MQFPNGISFEVFSLTTGKIDHFSYILFIHLAYIKIYYVSSNKPGTKNRQKNPLSRLENIEWQWKMKQGGEK